MNANNMKVGSKVAGVSNSPRLFQNGRELSNAFAGVVVATEMNADLDPAEEMAEVRFTKPGAWERIHGIKTAWFFAAELTDVSAPTVVESDPVSARRAATLEEILKVLDSGWGRQS